MSILYRYLMVVVACVSLLVGVQVPNFVDQYQKRVDAHLREATANLRPFQEIADKYFNGSLDRLIELNLKNSAKPLQEEGKAIALILKRKLRFAAEMAALQTNLPMKVLHVLFNGDREMIDETLEQYSYNVPFNQDALLFGAALSILTLLVVELLLALIRLARAKAIRPPRSPNLPRAQ